VKTKVDPVLKNLEAENRMSASKFLENDFLKDHTRKNFEKIKGQLETLKSDMEEQMTSNQEQTDVWITQNNEKMTERIEDMMQDM
jgi:hypothetical protein